MDLPLSIKKCRNCIKEYNGKLAVIGVPCNQFGAQEPGGAEEIKSFCSKNYGVEFLITEKIDVKGDGQHPLYSWLTDKKINGVKGSSIKWNFQKYLINPEGQLVDYYYSVTSPTSDKINESLKIDYTLTPIRQTSSTCSITPFQFSKVVLRIVCCSSHILFLNGQ